METIQPTAGCSYVARVAFDVGQLRFRPGDPVRCADVGVHEAVMFGWWQAGMIAVAPPDPVVSVVSAAPVRPPHQQHPKHQHRR